jgi:hypothetical protein
LEATPRNSSILVWALSATFSLVTAWYAGWRSEIIFFIYALGLGAAIRWPKRLPVLAAAAAALVMVLLPLAQMKKTDYQGVMDKPLQAVQSVIQTPLADRASFIAEFWAVRLNSEREIGFVQSAVDAGLLELRGGQTYGEALLQLIPRVVWPSKPVYNSIYGYTLPRAVGLLSAQDPSTSWAVNMFAEFIWNFRPNHLIWFVPLIFWALSKLDNYAATLENSTVRQVYCLSLFFQFLQAVSIVNLTTFILWLTLMAKLADRLTRSDLHRSRAIAIPGGAPYLPKHLPHA